MKHRMCIMIRGRGIRNLALLAVFPVCQMFIVAGIYHFPIRLHRIWYGIITIGLLLGVIAEFLFFRIVIKNVKREEMEREIQNMSHGLMMEELYQRGTEAGQRELEVWKAELWQTVEKAKEEVERGEEAGNILSFLKSTAKTGENVYCCNMIVNAVLDEKNAVCYQNGIELQCNIRIGEIPGIAKSHLCSIFTNLLDNAIAAVKDLPEKDRKIRLNAGRKAEYLIVKTDNVSTADYVNRNPLQNHGMGKQILLDLAKKYDGYYETEFKDGIYHATVIVKVGDLK